MINIKNNKGITLLTLVITIIVILILTVSIGASLVKTNDLKGFYKVKEDIILLSREVQNYYLENGEIPITDNTNYGTSFIATVNSKATAPEYVDRNPNDNDYYYKIDLNLLKNYVLSHDGYNLKINNSNDTYLVNQKTLTVYYEKGIKLDGKWHFTAFDGLSEGSFAQDFYSSNELPSIPVVTFESNRANKSYARIGDTLTLKLINNRSAQPYAKINGEAVTISWDENNSKIGTATYTIKNNNTLEDNSSIPFVIYYVSEDEAGAITRPTFTTGVFYEKVQIVNSPELTDGMIPIKFVYANNSTTEGNWVICSRDDKDWYDYRDKKWANVMLSDGTYNTSTAVGTTVADSDLGSMFVWIPRYAYSINQYKTAKDGEGTTQNITSVIFLEGTSNRDVDRKDYAYDYNVDEMTVGSPTPYIVHPAFKLGDEELTGLWVAKFEASMAETNNETNADNNVTTKTLKVLPEKESWRYINIGNMFSNCLNMKDKLNSSNNNYYGFNNNSKPDTHLMKNNEWGAVSYLTVSQYGSTPTINNYVVTTDDKHYAYTGRSKNGDSAYYTYRTNSLTSTTGNVTGIYDLNGGGYEYVAAYFDNGHQYLRTHCSIAFDTNKKLLSQYEKYWDKYDVGSMELTQTANDNTTRKKITDDRYNMLKNIKGDATYEIIKTYSFYGTKVNNSNDYMLTETTNRYWQKLL